MWHGVCAEPSIGYAGGARVKDCLEEHREDAGFSAECRAEFEKMMEARAADFRLDPTLREVRTAPWPAECSVACCSCLHVMPSG